VAAVSCTGGVGFASLLHGPIVVHGPPETRRMLVCCQGCVGELVVEVVGEVSLEGSHGFSLGLSFVDAALDVGAAGWMVDGARERDRVIAVLI
jgi:hypothetical protein